MGRSPKIPGSAKDLVEVKRMIQSGHIRLPNGLGSFTGGDGGRRKPGVAPSELTSVRHRDWLAAAPWHTHVPARLEPIA